MHDGIVRFHNVDTVIRMINLLLCPFADFTFSECSTECFFGNEIARL